MNQVKCELVANVIVSADRKGTMVLVKFGPFTVASARLGGCWNSNQALSEFRKCPKRFKVANDDAKKILESQGISV